MGDGHVPSLSQAPTRIGGVTSGPNSTFSPYEKHQSSVAKSDFQTNNPVKHEPKKVQEAEKVLIEKQKNTSPSSESAVPDSDKKAKDETPSSLLTKRNLREIIAND